MSEPSPPYSAVYHFRDDRLLSTFIANIPRSQLVDHLRESERLRNKYFPGFRMSPTVPTREQIQKAYQRQIVDHNDGRLASSLCKSWIRQHSDLAGVALKALGIQPDDPGDADLWIGNVHAILERDDWERSLRGLTRALAQQSHADDIHIFVSTISDDIDQQKVRRIVALSNPRPFSVHSVRVKRFC